MKIQYLKSLEANLKTQYSSKEVEGMSEEDIEKIETTLGITFPVTYREFLYLAGSYAGYLVFLDGTTAIQELADTEYQAYREKAYLNPFNFNEQRKHWTFATGSQAFWFFYLDEGTEDPIVWQVELLDLESYDQDYLGKKRTFSEFINNLVEYSIDYHRIIHRYD